MEFRLEQDQPKPLQGTLFNAAQREVATKNAYRPPYTLSNDDVSIESLVTNIKNRLLNRGLTRKAEIFVNFALSEKTRDNVLVLAGRFVMINGTLPKEKREPQLSLF